MDVLFERGGMQFQGETYWFTFWPQGILMIFRDEESCRIWASKQGLTPVFEQSDERLADLP